MTRGTRALMVIAVAVLAGCAHHIYIVGRTTGVTGHAEVTTFGNHSGPITIDLGSETYTGHWVYAPGGGALGIGTATAYAGGQSATATSTMVGLPMGGPGTVLATAPDGSSIRCGFTFSEWGRTGFGVCQDSHGAMYDLQID